MERPANKCPICGKPVTAAGPRESPNYPFCCARCKLIDLGRWLSGDYRIPAGKPEPPEPSSEG